MKPVPCFKTNEQLAEAAREAEGRKNRAIARLTERLGIRNDDRFEGAMRDPIDADKRALQEKGQ